MIGVLGVTRLLARSIRHRFRPSPPGRSTARISASGSVSSSCCSRPAAVRSEEHTSELQSQSNLVCRLLLEKKKNDLTKHMNTPAAHLRGLCHESRPFVKS